MISNPFCFALVYIASETPCAEIIIVPLEIVSKSSSLEAPSFSKRMAPFFIKSLITI